KASRARTKASAAVALGARRMSDIAKTVLATFATEQRSNPPSRTEIYTFVADAIETVVDELRTQAKALHARLDELEKSGARFRGVYQRAAAYRRGDQVTHRSSLWTALGDVPEGAAPGDNPELGQLAAKGIS